MASYITSPPAFVTHSLQQTQASSRSQELSSRGRRAALEAVLERSGAVELLDAWMPTGGRPGQLGAKAVLLGMLFGLDAGRPTHLSAGHAALLDLDVSEQARLGVLASPCGGALHPASYRQFSHAHQVMVGAIDPTPVPSFKGVYEEDRASHLAKARADVGKDAMRWITLGAPNQEDVAIVLQPPLADPGASEAERVEAPGDLPGLREGTAHPAAPCAAKRSRQPVPQK